MKYTIRVLLATILAAAVMVGISILFGIVEQQTIVQKYVDVNKTSSDSLALTIYNYKQQDDTLSYDDIIVTLPLYDFETITLVDYGGAVIASTNSSITGSYLQTLGVEAQRIFKTTTGGNFSLDGQDYFISKLTNQEWDMRLICKVSMEESVKTYDKIASINMVQIFFTIVSGIVYVIIVVFFYKRRFNQVYKVKPVANHILRINSHGRILECDKEFEKLYGKPLLRDYLKDDECIFEDELYSGRPISFLLKDKEGNTNQVTFTATVGLGCYKLVGGNNEKFLSVYDQYENEHCTDNLTGLPNHFVFDKVWDKFMAKKEFASGLVAVFQVMSLDYYRILLGQKMFDIWYKSITQKMREGLSDFGQLYSKDDYILLFIDELDKKEKFLKTTKEVYDKLNRVVSIGENVSKPDIRFGFITLDKMTKDNTIDEVLATAQIALNNALITSDAPYYYLRTDNFSHRNYVMATKKDIEELINSGCIAVWFQPQISAKDEKVEGFESLLRIVGDKAKDLNTGSFIDAAGKSGCMIELGEYIYKKAMDFAEDMQKYNVSVSINMSPIEMMHTGYIGKFVEEYKKRNIKPGTLHVEILESATIYSMKEITTKIDILHKNGIVVELDDFGTGYSSMEYLQELKIDVLKIDKVFVDKIETSDIDKQLLSELIKISKIYKMKTVCEGIETKQQLEIVKNLDCDVIQGYYYSKALPKEKAFKYLKEMNLINEE